MRRFFKLAVVVGALNVVELRDRIKVMILGKGSLRLRVKSDADCLASGSIFLRIRLRKCSIALPDWHAFSRQELYHISHLLEKLLAQNECIPLTFIEGEYLTLNVQLRYVKQIGPRPRLLI